MKKQILAVMVGLSVLLSGCSTQSTESMLQEVKKEVKEKEKTSRETLGKFFYDLAKISFTALVVGSVVSVATQQEKVENWVLILIGIFVTYIFSYIGYKIIKQ